MKAITEIYLRRWIRQKNRPKEFCLRRGMIITPAARQYLQEQRVELLADKKLPQTNLRAENAEDDGISYTVTREEYVSADGKKKYEVKPEYMTQLRGNTLVAKDDILIEFRGRLDSLQSEILLLHEQANAYSSQLGDDVAELLDWARTILQAEVLEKPLVERSVFSLSPDELRSHSHNPRKYYGIGHILPGLDMDSILLKLNHLRSTVREIELVAVKAFMAGDHPAGATIIQALNRMSSAVYILMLKCKAEKYRKGN